MRHVRKELKSLRYEIQRQKGHLNALDRQLARVHGKKIRYAAPDSKTDKNVCAKNGALIPPVSKARIP